MAKAYKISPLQGEGWVLAGNNMCFFCLFDSCIVMTVGSAQVKRRLCCRDSICCFVS
jgi:hypothetical protein